MNLQDGKRSMSFLIIIGLILIFSSNYLISSFNSDSSNGVIGNDQDELQHPIQGLNSAGDGITSYNGSTRWLEYGTFSSLGNWTAENDGGSDRDISIVNDKACLQISGSYTFNNRPRIVLNNLNPFTRGELYINYWVEGMTDNGLIPPFNENSEYLEVWYMNTDSTDWSTNGYKLTSTRSTSSSNSEVWTLTAASHGTNSEYFKIAIILNAQKSASWDTNIDTVGLKKSD
jgi:hypothetical protein